MTGACTELARRLDAPLRTIAVASHGPATVLAALHGSQVAVACYGTSTQQATTAVNTYTRFELGSITKTFTALLLAQMVASGDISYNDPITAYLPASARSRYQDAASITLAHLATHTGELPRVPANLWARAIQAWWTNPYASYRLEHLYRATAGIRARQPPGTRVRYSNFGVGLLGQLLANAAGQHYQDLIKDRVCRPLGMTDTHTAVDLACATGHRRRRPVPPWDMGALIAAGSLRSNTTDLLCYLDALLHPQTTPLTDALRAVQIPRVSAPGKDSVCLVWNHRVFHRYQLLFHSGATRGFTAFAGFCPQTRIGIIALTNGSWTRRSTLIPTAYALLKTLTKEQL